MMIVCTQTDFSALITDVLTVLSRLVFFLQSAEISYINTWRLQLRFLWQSPRHIVTEAPHVSVDDRTSIHHVLRTLKDSCSQPFWLSPLVTV